MGNAMRRMLQKLRPFGRDLATYFLTFYRGVDVTLSSIAVAYYLLVTVFPLLFLVAAILPYFSIDVDVVLTVLERFLPDQLYDSMSIIVSDVLTRPSTGWLGISILTLIWTFSYSMSLLQKAFNKAYGMKAHRDFIVSRIVGILIGVILQFFLLIAIVLIVFSQQVARLIQYFVHLEEEWYQVLLFISPLVAYIIIFLMLSLLYFILPNVKIKKIHYILPGSCFVMLVLITMSKFFSFYVTTYLTNYEDFRLISYLVVLVLMLWLILIARLLILGALFNASYQATLQGSERFSPRRGNVSALVKKYKLSRRIRKRRRDRRKQ